MEDNKTANYNLEKKLIFKKFRVGKLIYKSNLSTIHEGINELNGEQVALKFERTGQKYNFLESEAYFLFLLKGEGIPKIISYGKIIGFKVIIEELLGESIYLLWKNTTFDIKNKLNDLCLIAIQCLDRLKYIHSKNTLHRDIKPFNFLFGKTNPKLLYLIDFGISTKYRSSRTGKHIKFKFVRKAIGSLRYMSINSNSCYEQSRRDDLESLGYMLIYLIKKTLPWISIENSNINKIEKYRKVRDLKMSTLPEELCSGLPKEFSDYIKYCRNLSFEQEPNYNYLRNLFLEVIKKNEKIVDIRYIKPLQFSWLSRNNNRITKIDDNNKNQHSSISETENISSSRGKSNTHKRLYFLIKNSIERSKSQESPKIKTSNYLKLNLKNINIILNNINAISNKISIKNSKKKINIKNKGNENNKKTNIPFINKFQNKKAEKSDKITKYRKILITKPIKENKKNSKGIINMNNTDNNIISSTIQKIRIPKLDDVLTKVDYSKNKIDGKINLKKGCYKTLEEREKEKENKKRMEIIKDRIKNRNSNLKFKYNSENNTFNNNHDLNQIISDKKKKININIPIKKFLVKKNV